MLRLDHLTLVAPDLAEGVRHARACLDLDIPFGQHHPYMGTFNHRLRLGEGIYLEIVAVDPQAPAPARPRWFGLDDRKKVAADWDDGRRLRGWVAGVGSIDTVLRGRGAVFGERVSLPPENPVFDFAIPADGSLPLDGAAPSLIDRRGRLPPVAAIPDLGARLVDYTLECPDPGAVAALHAALGVDRPPDLTLGPRTRWRARIETPAGLRELT